LGSSDLAIYGDILRGSMKEFIGDFYAFLDVQTTLIAKFYGVIHAIKQAQKMSLTSLWLECDYALVCTAFTVIINVP